MALASGVKSCLFTALGKRQDLTPEAFNTTPQMLTAALEGYGLAYVPEDLVQQHVAEGCLVQVLEDWCPSIPGYHLYYPSRRQTSPAFSLVVNALRYQP
jgi:DNA-binding transcriptional LysR family regulator